MSTLGGSAPKTPLGATPRATLADAAKVTTR
jgi:hypothetical protein